MSSTDHIAAARDPEFSGRVGMLALTTAQNVASEEPTTPDHEARTKYAARVMRGAEDTTILSAHVIASNATISAAIDSAPELLGANVPDNDIAFALASIWTARALAFAVIGG
jgi:hypothetical protein